MVENPELESDCSKKQITESVRAASNLLFEKNIVQISRLVKIQVSKWKLSGGIPSVGKEDISQIVLCHLANKFHLYDPAQPLGNWLSRVISNKLKNLMRDLFYKNSQICLSCDCYMGPNQCRIFGDISTKCPLYKKWYEERGQSYNVNLPVTIEDHQNEMHSMPFEESDVDDQISDLKHKLEDRLSKSDYKIFVSLYLQNLTEDQVIASLGYRTRRQGEAQVKLLKQTILATVKQIISEEEIF